MCTRQRRMSLSLSTEVRVSVCGLTPCHSWLALAGGQLTAAQLLLPAAGLGYIRTSAWAGLGHTEHIPSSSDNLTSTGLKSGTSVRWLAWLISDRVYSGWRLRPCYPPPGFGVRAGD